jgi:hypothetical protein
MSDLDDIVAAYEEGFNAKREILGPDLCDLIKPSHVDGGTSGDTISKSTPESGIPCFFKPLGSNTQEVIGGEAYTATHEITMPRTEATSLITPEYRIKVLERDDRPEKIFQHPVIREGSFTPMVVVTASLVQQGYQQ